MRKYQSDEDLDSGLTGVRQKYRRHGVATAMKIKAIKYAMQHGYKTIKTGNDITNKAMLNLNRKLGFIEKPEWIRFKKIY